MNMMKINKRILLESIIVSALVVMTGIIVVVIWGVVQTKSHVPEVVESYQSASYLQHEVTFGITHGGGWAFILLIYLLLAVAYYGIRLRFGRTGKNGGG